MARPSLAGWTGLGVPVSPGIGGVALLACPAALLLALAPVADGARLLAGALALLLFATGLCGVRTAVVGVGLPLPVLAAAGVAVVTLVVATLLELPGGPLAVIVGVLILAVMRTSRWRVGDLSLLGLALALGAGTAYVLDNLLYVDNGSATDQAVPLLLIPSMGLALWSLARARVLAWPARAALTGGAVLGAAAFMVALATRDATFIWPAVPAGLLFGAGLVMTGASLLTRPAAASQVR